MVGPLASRSIEDLELFQRAVMDQEPWDIETSLVPVPWKRVAPTKDMTVGIMWDDGCVCSFSRLDGQLTYHITSYVRPHPPVIRALKYAKEKLLAAGIRVVDWEPYKHDHGWEIVVRSLSTEQRQNRQIQAISLMKAKQKSALYFPDAAQSPKTYINKSGEPTLPLTQWAFNYSSPTPLTIPENWALNASRDILRNEYHALMKSRGVDFLLTPVYPGAAAVLGESQYWNYTAIWNILDQPAVAFPSGIMVDGRVDGVEAGYRPRNEVDEREWRKYRPERYEGAPVGLQLVGKHFRDEEMLAAARVVEGVLLGGGVEREVSSRL